MQTPPRDVLTEFFQRSSLDGEQRVSRVRLVLAILGTLNILVAWNKNGGLIESGPKYLLMLGSMLMLATFSLWTLRIKGADTAPRDLAQRSILVDMVTSFAVVCPSVLWPSPTYTGLLSMPHVFAFPLGMIASSVRLSRPAVLLSVVGNLAAAVFLLSYDVVVWRERVHHPADDYAVYAIILTISALLAWTAVGRAEALVREGGQGMVREERARQALSVYLSKPVAEVALEENTLRPGGERRQVAVLFVDLRGFSAWSATLPPERLVDELNGWLDAMVRVVREEGGVVDKYIGDAIMAVWGVPQSCGDDAARAIRAAGRMVEALEQHNRRRAARGLPPLRQGVGVDYGPVIAGNVGAPERLQYTVMGDAVNLASRLQAATRDLGTPVLVSEAAMQAATPFGVPLLVPVGRILIRGRDEPLPAFGLASAPISLVPTDASVA